MSSDHRFGLGALGRKSGDSIIVEEVARLWLLKLLVLRERLESCEAMLKRFY